MKKYPKTNKYDSHWIEKNWMGPNKDNSAVSHPREMYQSETDNRTGYALAFMLEEMILLERLSCYKFRMQWLVDGNYWSTVGFVAIAPDGRIIEHVD